MNRSECAVYQDEIVRTDGVERFTIDLSRSKWVTARSPMHAPLSESPKKRDMPAESSRNRIDEFVRNLGLRRSSSGLFPVVPLSPGPPTADTMMVSF